MRKKGREKKREKAGIKIVDIILVLFDEKVTQNQS